MSIIRRIQIGDQTIALGRDVNGRYVQLDDERYHSLERIVDKVESWKRGKGIRSFAEISNFLLEGLDFQVLASKGAIRRFKESSGSKQKAQVDYGVFNLQELRLPFVDGDYVIFYLRQQDSGIPFRAKVPFPYRVSSAGYSYEPLSYQN